MPISLVYDAYLPCLRCPSPLFMMPISLVYDAHLHYLRCLSPLFTILFCVFDDGFAHFRAYFSLCGECLIRLADGVGLSIVLSV